MHEKQSNLQFQYNTSTQHRKLEKKTKQKKRYLAILVIATIFVGEKIPLKMKHF